MSQKEYTSVFILPLSLRRKASPAIENFHLGAISPEQLERLESKWDFRTGPFSDNLSKESGPELLLGRHEKLSVCEKILHSYFLFKT